MKEIKHNFSNFLVELAIFMPIAWMIVMGKSLERTVSFFKYLDAEVYDHETEDSGEENEQESDEMDILDDPDFQNMSDSDMDDLPLFENLSEDEKSDHEEGTYRAREKKMSKERSDSHLQQSEVDDQFFKLRDMEKFLEAEDRREETGGGGAQDEDDIDLFGDIEDGEDDGPAMYSNYFRDEDQSLDKEYDDANISKMDEGEESEDGSDKEEEDSNDESMDDEENDLANDKVLFTRICFLCFYVESYSCSSRGIRFLCRLPFWQRHLIFPVSSKSWHASKDFF